MTLDSIALETGTDKSSKLHNYTPEYERHFESRRHEPLRLLEIGVDKGTSLLMWRKYFDKAQAIVGIDINEPLHLGDDIICLKGNQTDTNFLKYVSSCYGPFDVIVDDGSHFNQHQEISFSSLFPKLKSGGWYIIEDIYCQYWVNTGRPQFDYGKLIGDLMNWGRTDRPGETCYFDKSFPVTNLNIKSIELYKDIMFVGKK